MSYDTHMFYRAICDYPGCPAYHRCEYEWWADESDASESVWNDPWWLLLDDDDGSARFFCPDHLLFADDGQPVRFDPDADDDKCMPRNAELITYYLNGGYGPLPKLECEDTIREILKGDSRCAPTTGGRLSPATGCAKTANATTGAKSRRCAASSST